jgi:hypothetical protein
VTSENHTLQLKRGNQEQIQIPVPARIIYSLKKEFNIQDDREVIDFIITLIEKNIANHIAESNSKAFSEAEVKGLGYI